MEDNSQDYIGINIRAIRVNYGLSQEKFAELAGTSQAAVSAWECGTTVPRKSSIARIVASLPGLSADDILSKETGFSEKMRRSAIKLAEDIIEKYDNDQPTLIFDPVKAKLDAAYEMMSDDTRMMIADLATSLICDPARRR